MSIFAYAGPKGKTRSKATCRLGLSEKQVELRNRMLENLRHYAEINSREKHPVIIPQNPKTQALSLSKISPAENALMTEMEEARRKWLFRNPAYVSVDGIPKRSPKKSPISHKREAELIADLSLVQRLRLYTAAMNDFNKLDRYLGRESFPEPDRSPRFRMAAMINQCSRSSYQVKPLSPSELEKRTLEHLVLSYFKGILHDNAEVGPYREAILSYYPETRSLFELSELDGDLNADRYIPSIDEKLMHYFLFEYKPE